MLLIDTGAEIVLFGVGIGVGILVLVVDVIRLAGRRVLALTIDLRDEDIAIGPARERGSVRDRGCDREHHECHAAEQRADEPFPWWPLAVHESNLPSA